ncbi:MAG: helix-turn-helix domain-containing protein [Ferruginibacter sp.]
MQKDLANNSNNTVNMPVNGITPEIRLFILQTAAQLVEQQTASCLLFKVQCVNIGEAAKLLSVEDDTIRDWIKNGKLTASKIGREWIIRLTDIDSTLIRTASVVRMDKRYKAARRNTQLDVPNFLLNHKIN